MTEGTRQAYPTALTDQQWDILNPLLPVKKGKGRNQEVDLREILNAIFYLLRTGCHPTPLSVLRPGKPAFLVKYGTF